MLREAHHFSTLTKGGKERGRLKLLRKVVKEGRRPFCEDVKVDGGMSRRELEAYEELVEKPHQIRQHYSLSDSENLSGCGVEEVMVSRSDGCEVPAIDDQLRLSCNCKRHISCHSLPTPDPPNNPSLYRQHSLPSYYPVDPPPLPLKTNSKSNLSSKTFFNSPPFSIHPSHKLRDSPFSIVPPLPIKNLSSTHLSMNPPIPPKHAHSTKQSENHSFFSSSTSESFNKKKIATSISNSTNDSLTSSSDYYNQRPTKDPSEPSFPPPKSYFSQQHKPKPPRRPLHLQLLPQPPPPPSFKHHHSPLQVSPPPLKPPPQTPDIPPELPIHNSLFSNCHLKTPLTLHNTCHHLPLSLHPSSASFHSSNPFSNPNQSTNERCSQTTGRYETSDSLVYEDVDVFK